jgi:hypothetical protein
LSITRPVCIVSSPKVSGLPRQLSLSTAIKQASNSRATLNLPITTLNNFTAGQYSNNITMTSPTTHTAMPGAFNFSRDQGAPPRISGAKSHVFQPPSSPSASSSLYLARSATSSAMSYEHISTNTRKKRSRTDYYKEQTPESDLLGGDPGSPMPFVNTRYALAGGMDTPTLKAAERYEGSEQR